MQVIAQAHERWDSAIKSFTLADFAPPPIPRARPRTWSNLTLLSKTLHFAKAAVIAWGVISLGAVAGMGIYYLNGAPETPLLVSASPRPVVGGRQLQTPVTTSVSARERLAMLMDGPSPLITTLPSPSLAQALTLRASTPIAAARMPRPRPEEPIITGSIGPPAYDPSYVAPTRRRTLDPCAALKSLGAPYLFGNRCGPYTRAYPPPPRQFDRAAAAPPARQYAPQPYHPPILIGD